MNKGASKGSSDVSALFGHDQAKNAPWIAFKKSGKAIFEAGGKGGQKLCFDFQTVEGCKKDTCPFKHACMKCGKEGHGFMSKQCW